MPDGHQGWMAYKHPELKNKKPVGLMVGDYFPACHLVILRGKADREYLGLPSGAKAFTLTEVSTRFLLVELYNEYCITCQKEVPFYNKLSLNIDRDPALEGKMKMIGLGVGSTHLAVARFRRREKVRFPLFADQNWEIHKCLGQPTLPIIYLLEHQQERDWRILFIHTGHSDNPADLLAKLKAIIAGPKRGR